MANRQEIKKMYKISQRLEKAFKEVTYLCGKYLSLSDNSQDKSRNSSPQKNQPKKSNKEKQKEQIKEDDGKKRKIIKINRNQPSQKSQIVLERPKAPLTPFFLFMTKNKDRIAEDYPTLNGQQISNLMGEVWQGLTDEQKKPYVDQYDASKALYQKRLKQYYTHNPQEKGKKQTKAEKAQQKISQSEEQRLKARIQMLKKMGIKPAEVQIQKQPPKQGKSIFPFKPQTLDLEDSQNQEQKKNIVKTIGHS